MRIGVDVGGTKIEAVALGAGGVEVFRRRVATPRDDYEATLAAIAALVEEAEVGRDRPASVGVGIPGTISPATGLVKNANSTWLNGRPLDRDLARALGRPVRVANDANCFALSEATDGAGRGARVVFGVIIGTGTGGGIVVDGRVLTGPNAIAGEWGHNPLPWAEGSEIPGDACYCGRRGCIETWLSGPGLRKDHRRTTGEVLEPAQIVLAAASGDAGATASIGRYYDRMARALASLANVLDPDVIVLGGGMSAIGGIYEEVPRLWGRHAFTDRLETRLVPPFHGDSSGVRGAAWLWPADGPPGEDLRV